MNATRTPIIVERVGKKAWDDFYSPSSWFNNQGLLALDPDGEIEFMIPVDQTNG